MPHPPASSDAARPGRGGCAAEMVERFVAPRGVDDPRVLAAMAEVPRHRFVPEPVRSKAYGDHSLPIGHGQTISQPFVVGLMTQRLALSPEHKVLEIGTGSGYQAAILASARAHGVFAGAHRRARAGSLGASESARVPERLGQDLRRHVRIPGGRALRPDPRDGRGLRRARAAARPARRRRQARSCPSALRRSSALRVIRRRKDHFAQEDGEDVVFVPLVGRFGRAAAP